MKWLWMLMTFWMGGTSLAVAGSNVYVGTEKPAKRVSMDQINHSQWNELVGKHVSETGRVNYRAWHASQADRRALQSYLRTLSTANAGLQATKSAKLAFWINAYNAVTVEGILREYPTSSIRNHTAKLFGYNIWDDLQLYVGGKAHSLNQIEHEILRKMGEPRIHFAIVCASKGCPRLLNEAYVADRLDEQLTTNAKDFFAQSRNFSVRGKVVTMSSILDWFGEDFGEDKAALIRRIRPWLSPADSSKLSRAGSVSIQFADYDWSLNE